MKTEQGESEQDRRDRQASEAAERFRHVNHSADTLNIALSYFRMARPAENPVIAAFELLLSVVRDHREQLARQLEFCNELADRGTHDGQAKDG